MKHKKIQHPRYYFEADLSGGGAGGGGGSDTTAGTGTTANATPPPASGAPPSNAAPPQQAAPPPPRAPLSEVISRHLQGDANIDEAARTLAGEEEKPARDDASKQPAPKVEEKPQAAALPKKDAPAPATAAKPAAAKPDAKAEGEGDTTEEEELELLGEERINKDYPTASQALRQHTLKLEGKLKSLQEMTQSLGGEKGLKHLEKTGIVLTRTDAPAAKDLQANLKEWNPSLLSHLQSDIFFGAVDERPDLLNTLIQSATGNDALDTKAIEAFAWAVKEGEKPDSEIGIDLKELMTEYEKAKGTKDPEAQKKIDALEGKVKDLEGKVGDPEKEKRFTQIRTDTQQVSTTYQRTIQSVLSTHKLLPVTGQAEAKLNDPPEVVAVKERIIKSLLTEIGSENINDDTWKSMDGMIVSGLKGDTWDWTLERAMNAAKGRLIEKAKAWQPVLNAYLKYYNSLPKETVTTRRPDNNDTINPPPQAENGTRIGDLTPEQRRAGLHAKVQQNLAAG